MTERAAATLPAVRAVVIFLCLLAVAGCGGPLSPTEAGGPAANPVALLHVLPSPGDLRGAPEHAADASLLQRALTGAPDPAVAARIRALGPKAAAVRSWTGPHGQELVIAVSVWNSHLVATGIGGDAAQRLIDGQGARAWTPPDAPGSRGAALDQGMTHERRLSFAVGPNSLYVRSAGPVPDAVVVKQLKRMIETLQGQS